MAKPSELSDEALDLKIESLVRSERELLIEILVHLREADRRRLYAKYEFPSLFEYAVGRFKYSRDEAYNRIAAMKMLADVPEIEEKIEILEKLENCTKVAAEQVLKAEGDKNSLFGVTGVEVGAALKESMEFEANSQLRLKLQRLMKIKSHAIPSRDLGELIDRLADLVLEKWDLKAKAEQTQVRAERARVQATKNAEKKIAPERKRDGSVREANRRAPPAAVKHALILRDGACCVNCGSAEFLEIDHHPIPFALGGSDALENLRLLCRSCNQRHAIEVFGVEKMAGFLREPRLVYH